MSTHSFFLERGRKDQRTFPILDDSHVTPLSNLIWLTILAFAVEVINVLLGTLPVASLSRPVILVIAFIQTIGIVVIFALLYRYLGHQKFGSLFHKITLGDAGFGIVMFVLASIYSNLMTQIIPGIADKVVTGAGTGSTNSQIKNIVVVNFLNLFSLLSEELLAIIPFLAVAAIAYQHLQLSRNTSIWLGWLASIILFGAFHFYAYDWHLLQMFLIIGMSRVFYTGMYIRTKNILVSYVAHWLFDAVLMVLPLFIK